MTKLNIAFAPDDRYMNMTIVSMFSALQNNIDSQIEFIILYSKLSDASWEKLKNFENKFNCSIRYIKMNEEVFKDLPMSKWVTVQAWFRIQIPDLCPDLDRVLYLDCDTMVNGDIKELFTMEMGNNYVAAVKDVWDVKKHLKRLDMKSDSYFNSGVLLMNCEQFRKDNVFEKIKEYSLANKKIIKFCDQDTLNKVIDTKKINLPQKYNFMDTWWRNNYNEYEGEDLVNYEIAKESPLIVHLTGPKPNVKGCKNSMAEKWWYYARLTDVYLEETQKFKNSKDCKKKIKPLSLIFNIKNEYRGKDKWKVLTLLGFKLKFRKECAEKVFVIFNTAFIGDILLNNGLVQNIKHFYPNSKVVFVVQPQFVDVAKYQKGVDDVVSFDKKHNNNLLGVLNFVKNFPYKKIFASFVIYSNDRNLILSRLLGAEHIMTEPHNKFTEIMSTKEEYKRNTYIHKKDISTGLIESLTGKAILDLPIVYEPPYVETDFLPKDKEYVAITATSKFKPKDMPPEIAVKLINKLKTIGKTPIILGAGEAARSFARDIEHLGADDVIDLVDKTDFVQLANVLKRCSALISVDTGTMHFGNALNIPTIAVFYSHAKEMWAPNPDLYKTIVLSGTPNAEEIFEALKLLIDK